MTGSGGPAGLHDRVRDGGVVIPLVTLGMLVLIVFTALAVDVGLAYAYRRTDQGAVDTSAISSGFEFVYQDSASNRQTLAFDEVVRLTFENSNTNLSAAQWEAAWATGGCDDSQASVGGPWYPITLETASANGQLAAGSVVDCVSFDISNPTTVDPSAMRVKLPTTDVPGVFAPVLGVEFDSSAFAEVEFAVDRTNRGNVLPFAWPSAAAGLGAMECIKEGSAGSDLCPNTDGTGNYGKADLSVYGLGVVPDNCSGYGNTHNRTATNTAWGLGYALSTWTSGAGTFDNDECDGAQTAAPDSFWVQTGNAFNGTEDGLLDDDVLSYGKGGRLTRCVTNPGFPYTCSQVVSDGANRPDVDRTPMWEFLKSTTPVGTAHDTEAPVFCHPGMYDSFASSATLDAQLSTLGLGASDVAGARARAETLYGATYPLDLQHVTLLQECFHNYDAGVLYDGGPSSTGSAVGCGTGAVDENSCYQTTILDMDSNADGFYDIEDSPRFAWVPQVVASSLGNGTTPHQIRRFVPLYIQGLGFGQGVNECVTYPIDDVGSTCTLPVAHNWSMKAFEGMVIRSPMLPAEIVANNQSFIEEDVVRLLR